MIVKEISVKRALSRSGLRELDYSLNPYHGCSFSCVYCYAKVFTREKEASENWGEVVFVKKNIVEVLSREVKEFKKGLVGVSTITDPYQGVEAIYKITRESLKKLLQYGFRVSIQTKSPLILRDLDLLERFRGKVDVGITITTLDVKTSKYLEPRAPLPKARVNALRKLSERGIKTWIFLGPLIYSVNDSGFEEVIKVARETNSEVIYDKFNFYRGLTNYSSPKGWWEAKEREIKRKCYELGVECHSEREDWIFERGKQGRLSI